MIDYSKWKDIDKEKFIFEKEFFDEMKLLETIVIIIIISKNKIGFFINKLI